MYLCPFCPYNVHRFVFSHSFQTVSERVINVESATFRGCRARLRVNYYGREDCDEMRRNSHYVSLVLRMETPHTHARTHTRTHTHLHTSFAVGYYMVCVSESKAEILIYIGTQYDPTSTNMVVVINMMLSHTHARARPIPLHCTHT